MNSPASNSPTSNWLQRYLDRRRATDRLVTVQVIERPCRACGQPFLVAPHRPDSDYCPTAACKAARYRKRHARNGPGDDGSERGS